MKKECFECLNHETGYCHIHRPTPPTLEDSIAIACQHLVDTGVAERLSDETIRIF